MRLKNFIANEFTGPQNQRWFPHVSPRTGEAQYEVPDSSVLDLARALQAANKAWVGWQKEGASARAHWLREISKQLEARTEELARLQEADEGTPAAFTNQYSIPKAIAIFRAAARLIETPEMAGSVLDGAIVFRNRMPHGVVAVLTPYCDPFVSLARQVAPALAAGNVVIAKPSEFSPASAQAFAECVLASGLPSGVFTCLQGRGEEIGAALASHPGLSVVSFTGRTETGRAVLAASSEFLKRTHLALGARNPVLVFAGVDLKKVIPQIVRVSLQFHGLVCARGSRIFVQESIYREFLDLYKLEAEKFAPGLGPLVRGLDRERFQAAVQLAGQENGKILFGTSDQPKGPGFRVHPTAIYDLTLCSTLQQDEILGPFVTISSFKYQHDAIKQANTNPFGHSAYVFENDGAKAIRVAKKLEAAQVLLNTDQDLTPDDLEIQFMKASGLGRGGLAGLIHFFSKSSLILQNTGVS